MDKPPGLPVQADRTGDASLLELLQGQLPGVELGSPHRIDRPVSGLVVFTKSREALQGMAASFREHRVEKTYLAVVEGKPATTEGTLEHRLQHTGGTRKARIVEAPDGTVAVLRYHTRQTGDRYTVLEVSPEGGAFHQIRAQLAAAGNPIKGDVKYGAHRGEKDRSIALHAWRLRFPHPVNGNEIRLEAPIPDRGIWKVLMAQ